MSEITVTNADEVGVRRFGEWIEPGKKLTVSSETVIAYSAMEIALATQIMTRRVSTLERLLQTELDRQEHERRIGHPVHVKLFKEKEYSLSLTQRVKRYFRRTSLRLGRFRLTA